jgi:hypothetical protein
MRFQLVGCGWSVGAFLVPQGTILDSTNWTWHGMPLPSPPPVNAAAMDQEAFNELLKHYPANRILIAGENINR